jgi:Ca2+-binding EF-hand superfamily protein
MKITKNTTADNTDRMAFVRDAFDLLDSSEYAINTIRLMRMMREQGFDATLDEMREICEWLDAAWRVAGLEKGGVRQSNTPGWSNPFGNSEPLGDELT